MTDDLFIENLATFDQWIDRVIQSLSPQQRLKLFKDISTDLRRANQKRISQQVDPDGQKWQARKKRNGSGKIRSKTKMMMGLRQTRRLKRMATSDGAAIGYEGRNAQIAAVHQLGGLDAVSQDGGNRIRYPVRQLLGLSVDDLNQVRDRVFQHIDKGFG